MTSDFRIYDGHEQLLLLQQILFYRELGFELATIQKIIGNPSFDKAAALRAHRESLSQQADRTQALIQSIDHLGDEALDSIAESKRRTIDWSKAEYAQVQTDFLDLNRQFTDALVRGLAPDQADVQALVRKHDSIVDRFWTPTRESYIGLGRGYLEHLDFVKLYASHHPKLVEFLAEAMRIFAETGVANLKVAKFRPPQAEPNAVYACSQK